MTKPLVTNKDHDLTPKHNNALVSLLDNNKVDVLSNRKNHNIYLQDKETHIIVAEFICDSEKFRFNIIYKQRIVFSGFGPVCYAKPTNVKMNTFCSLGNALYAKARNLRYNKHGR